MGFLLGLKQNCPRSKILAAFILNIYQIELILSLIIKFNPTFYDDAVKFIFHFAFPKTSAICYVILSLNIIILSLTILQGNINSKSPLYSKLIHTSSVKFIKMFPYVGFIPLTVYNLSILKTQSLSYQIISIINIFFFIIYYQLNEISNWAYRFIEVDYCNQRGTNQFTFILMLLCLILLEIFSPFYASFIYLGRGLLKLFNICYHYQFPLIQKVDLHYGLFSIFLFGIVFGCNFFNVQIFKQIRQFTILLLFGLVVCYISINTIILKLNYERIKNSPQITLMDKDQSQSCPQNASRTIEESQNVLRILTSIYLQRQKMDESQPNSFSDWWQIFNRVVMIHRIQCEKPKCLCLSIKNTYKAQSNIYITELLKVSENICLLNTKLYNLKIMSIYIFIQIAQKPLKAYYEIMRLKHQKINSDTHIELQYLIKQTRQCFDQVFLKSKAKNQELQLLKVIQYQQRMLSISKNLDDIIQRVINFHELFLYSTVKTSIIKRESQEIFYKKKQFEDNVYNIILYFSQNPRLNLFVFVFYRYLQVYKSKQVELKKLSSQQQLKKRIYQKNQANIFSPQFGSIYIDLVQERGKILNLTSNMCEAFGYARDQMLGFNIRRYMPNIYARFHDRFLSNFVEKGKIKLLKQKERLIFAKNKKKFIFPVNVRLKAEYLLENQFGSSSLINAVDTNSQFIMVGGNGKLQQITQNMYKKLFGDVFRDQVPKCNRLSVFKMLPSLNRIYQVTQDTNPMANKIYQGILLYSNSQELLNQKFRYARDLSIGGGTTTNSKASIISSKMSIMSSTNTSTVLMQQSEIVDFLTETFKAFLIDVNIFKLKGFKVSYKISTVHTSQFDLSLLQFITFEQIQGAQFYRTLIDQLKHVAQIYQLNQEHGPIMSHLNQMQQISINENKCREHERISQMNNQRKVDFATSNQYEEVKRKRQSYEKNGTLDNKHFNDLLGQQSQDSFIEDQQIQNIAYQDYQRSQQSSVLGNTESDSKKQILINAFNSKESAISRNILIGLNLGIFLVIVILILLSVFSILFVYNNQYLWTDIRFLFTTNQVTSFKIALLETELFQKNLLHYAKPSSFIKSKKLSSSNKLKTNLEQINNNTIDTSLTNNFYIQTVQVYNPITNTTSQVTLIQFLNRYLYMLMYQSEQNIQNLRNNYGSMNQIFRKLQSKKLNIIENQQLYSFNRIIVFLALYFLLLLLTNALILPIYSYYKNQQNNVIGLLSYMSVKQIRRSIQRFKFIKQLLKSRQNNVNNFYSIMAQNSNEKKSQRTNQMDVKTANKTLKITSEHDDTSSLKFSKVIIILFAFIVFLSNFAIASFYITFTAQQYFTSNIQATKLAFQFQNKSPLLINTLMSNVNRYMKNQTLITYPESVYIEGSNNFFSQVQQLSKQKYKGSKISQLIHQMFSSQLCSQVINCTSTSTYHKSDTISFQYLVYQFKEKFSILLPEDKYNLTSSNIQKWIQQNKMENFILWLEQIMTMARTINTQVDSFFSEDEQRLQIQLLIYAIILIPINIVLIIFAQIKFLKFINTMLKGSQDVFRHFNISVLVQNTYLTSYFNSKIKQNK